MFTGIPYYGTTYGNRPYTREMGETPEDMAKAVKWQEEQAAKADRNRNSYRGREVGERPEDVPSREQQAEYSRQWEQRYGSSTATNPSRNTTRPREMGETPEDVARSQQSRPKTYDEMTEQERVLDLYA